MFTKFFRSSTRTWFYSNSSFLVIAIMAAINSSSITVSASVPFLNELTATSIEIIWRDTGLSIAYGKLRGANCASQQAAVH